ncbi:MAG: hypothetical protein IJ193_09810 [Bacilli bacterium]|nr:hypothetical protein [Bacilli bacterium]
MAAKDDEYRESIKDYEKNIITMKNFIEACRNNPAHIIGYKEDPRAHLSCFREVLQNGIDEIIRPFSPADFISVEYYEKDGQYVVFDGGRGIPRSSLIRVFTQEYTSSNYNKSKLSKYNNIATSGKNGIGSKACNALSDYFEVICYICDKYSQSGKPEAYTIRFEHGYPTTKEPVDYPNPNNIQGTRVEFKIDESILGSIRPSCEDIVTLVNTISHLAPLGSKCDIHIEPIKGKNYDIHIVNNRGVVDLLYEHNDNINLVIPPIYIHKENSDKTISCDVAIGWNSNGIDEQEVIYSYANTCIVIPGDSTHVKGFLEGVTNFFREYMNKFVLTEKSKFSTINSDIKAGLRAEVSIFHINAQFSSQSKILFSNLDAIPFMKDAIREGLDEWCKQNATQLEKLCKYFKDVGNLRVKTDTVKIQLQKNSVSVFSGMPQKYDKASGKDHLELLIVEGDSAAATTEVARDHKRQAIFAIRGKVKNALTCSKVDFFKNEECKAIYTILGCGEGRRCSPEQCIFEKVIFLSDADADGFHIKTLLLKMFLTYYAPLVAAGRVYAAVPPLYSIMMKNGERRFFTDDKDFVSYIFKSFSKSNEVRTSDNKKMSNAEVIQLLTNNIDYSDIMERLAPNHAMNPDVLEFIYSRIVKNMTVKQIARECKAVYPYLNISENNGIIVGDGLVNAEVETDIFHEETMRDCNALILPYLNNSDPNGYILNGYKVSLYQLMSAFNKYRPKSLTRYKGKVS